MNPTPTDNNRKDVPRRSGFIKKLVSQVTWFLFQPLLEVRTQRLAKIIGAHLNDGDRVLDVGCGNMRIGREILRTKKLTWIGVDTIDYHEGDLEFHLYDGKKLPFPSNDVQVILFSFVLHHCFDPAAVLDEACRVAEKRLIILEDIAEGGRFRRWLVKCHDYLANKLFEPDMTLPYAFKTRSEWLEIFQSRGLNVTSTEPVKTQPLFAFGNQTLFVLDKQ
jgi:SAM-dependent methyltransferase